MRLDDLIQQLQDLQEEVEYNEINYVDVFVHYQPNWPLKARITNIRLMDDGTVAIAVNDTGEYGDREAWIEC